MATNTTTPGGAALRELRLEHALTQDELSTKTGVNQGYISQIETGERPLTGTIALRVTMKLGVDVMRLAQHVPLDDEDGPMPDGPTTAPYPFPVPHLRVQEDAA